MAYQAPTTCPVCGTAMQIAKLHCPHCESELSGRFSPCRFCALPEKDLRFVEVFLKCRGSIKDVERELGVSYPTVRNMLDSALRSLGYDNGTAAQAEEASDARREIIDLLEKGEIDAAEAAGRLKALGRNSP